MEYLLRRLSSLTVNSSRTLLCASCRRAYKKPASLSLSSSPSRGAAAVAAQRRIYTTARAPKKAPASTPKDSSSGQASQASPLEGYYKLLLDSPLQHSTSSTRPSTPRPSSSSTTTPTTPQTSPTSPPPPTSTTTTTSTAAQEQATREARARVIFGSRLAGPAERRDELQRLSTNVAGVLVPPRPTEPDNCCMSGCVNCVWDRYRDELEEWAAKTAEARRRLMARGEWDAARGVGSRRQGATTTPTAAAAAAAMGGMMGGSSMDDDGGGSETNWGGVMDGMDTDLSAESLFKGIPVGIREFMRTEKSLREKRAREAQMHG